MIVNTIANYNVNAASYNATTGIWQFGYNPTPLATGIWCGTFSNVGAVLPTGYSLTAVYFLFFYSGVGGGFGLANSYANAVAEVPVIFTTGGSGSLVFKKQGGNYTLQARVPECCDEPYFNGISPTSNGPYIFPNYWAKYATINFQTFTRSSTPLQYGDYEPNPDEFLAQLNADWVLLPWTVNGFSLTSRLPLYENGRYKEYGGGNGTAVSCFLSIAYDGSSLTYSLNVSGVTRGSYTGSLLGTSPLWTFSKTIPMASVVNINDILSGTVALDTFSNPSGSPSYANVPSVYPTIVFSDNISDFVLPATLTLTKTVDTYLYKTSLYSAYPTRGWTTNNYTSELPNSITLNKLAGYNIYEAEFTTAVNVINRVRLKLTYFFEPNNSRGGWGYATYDWFNQTYLPGVKRWMTFTTLSPTDGTINAFWPPTITQSGTVALSLFRMAGTPNTAGVQYCYGFANYTMEPTAIP